MCHAATANFQNCWRYDMNSKHKGFSEEDPKDLAGIGA